MKVPILFLIFNRSDLALEALKTIRLARPSRLYIGGDGARASGGATDAQKVVATREAVLKSIDWPCQVKTRFLDENQGCCRAVSGALDWFFSQEEAGIVIEEDCLLAQDWFTFAEQMLHRYADNDSIMAIAAQHPHGSAHEPATDYYYSMFFHCWGWATWRRAWKQYESDLADWPIRRKTNWLRDIGNNSWLFEIWWRRIFDDTYAGRNDSWAYRYMYTCWKFSGLTVLPARNLVTNIGFGGDATHTTEQAPKEACFRLGALPPPYHGPPKIESDILADQWSKSHIYGMSWVNLGKSLVWKIPGAIYFWKRLKSVIRRNY